MIVYILFMLIVLSNSIITAKKTIANIKYRVQCNDEWWIVWIDRY